MKYIFFFFIALLGSSFLWESNDELIMEEVTCTCDRGADSLVLLEIYDSTTLISDWQTPWDYENEPMDNWYGVTLNNEGCVDSLWNGLNIWNGKLPQIIGNLSSLKYLFITSNFLTGNIPSNIGNLSNLEELHLRGQFTGNFPTSIGDLFNLKKLNLGGDFIVGTIPSAIGYLSNLEELSLNGGNLIGPIPSSFENLIEVETLSVRLDSLLNIPEAFGNLVSLRELKLGFTNLIYPIPDTLKNLSNLRLFSLTGTQLDSNNYSGNIPDWIGDLSNLRELNFNTCNLIGTIPNSIGNLNNLESLSFYNNSLTGLLPTDMGNLQDLTFYLRLDNNNFNCELPNWIGNFTKLRVLYLNDNDFFGSIPTSFNALIDLKTCYLQDNNFSGILFNNFTNLHELKTLDISNNNFVGNIPNELTNLNNLNRVFANGNHFSGVVPDFTFANQTSGVVLSLIGNEIDSLPPLSNSINWNGGNQGLNISNNKLTFDDIIPNLNALNSISHPYTPQDTVYVDTTILIDYLDTIIIDLGIDKNISNNIYTWFKDGIEITTIYGNNNFKIEDIHPDDAGVYFCQITNSNIQPSDLTLTSNNIQIDVITPGRIMDSLELLKFYNATNGDDWIESWDFSQPLDSFKFVVLSNEGRVFQLRINSENNLNGEIIDLNLPELTTLNIINNDSLISEIPNFTNLPNLVNLQIQACNLFGKIPNFSNLPFLRKLNLINNNLIDTLPNFSDLPFLESIYVGFNSLDGNLPTFENCSQLEILDLSYNQFSGKIPDFQLLELWSLSLINNDLDSLPNSFLGVPKMLDLDISANNLKDSFPDLSYLIELERLYLNNNDLVGEVKTLDNLTELNTLDLSHNNLYGVAPSLPNTELDILILDYNNFDTLPNYGSITSWSDCSQNCGFQVQGNKFTFDDIIPNMPAANWGTWYYFPQDSFYQKTELYLTTEDTYTIDLQIDESITNNQYQWFRNGNPMQTTPINKLTLDNLSDFNIDTITCKVTNPQVPDLTLYSRPTIITICEPSETFITETLCDGGSLTVNGTIYNQDQPEGEEYIDVPDEEGCDSLINIMLSFYPKSERIINDTIIEGGSYELDGTQYNTTGESEIIKSGQAATGCDSFIILNLTVLPPVEILGFEFPNGITPNGDGLNDNFEIPALQDNPNDFPENELIIFGRNGGVIFKAAPYQNDWGGTNQNGKNLPPGVYYFSFSFIQNGKRESKQGRILLKK